MSEEHDAIDELQRLGALGLIEWASATNFARVLQDYDEAAGHDQAVVGVHGYKYFIDLFDRATSSGKYALPSGGLTAEGRDILRAGIGEEAYAMMPRFEPTAINRGNYNGSPGWIAGGIRWLLQSFPFGDIDKIAWNQKSPSKLVVAQQPVTAADPALFGFEEMGLPEPEVSLLDDFVGVTLILAHCFNRETGAYEVYIGHSRASGQRGTGPWHWRRLVATGGPGLPTSVPLPDAPAMPGTPPTPEAEDAEVRLRPNDRPATANGN